MVVDKEVIVMEVVNFEMIDERVVVADLVVVNLKVEGVDEDYLMKNLVYFGTYYRPDLGHQS